MTEQYGPELVINGDFADGSTGWTIGAGWSVSGGQLIYTESGISLPSFQELLVQSGRTYRVSFEVVSLPSGGDVEVSLGLTGDRVTATSVGIRTATVQAAGSRIYPWANVAFGQSAVIDNISVKLVIPDGALIAETTPGRITIKFAVPLGHAPGDYAMLFSNNGSGSIDWDTPVTQKTYPLFPNAAGNYGFGQHPFGVAPFGSPAPKNLTRGFGTCPFGMAPFGGGSVLIKETVEVADCGDWLFAVKCFDTLGNAHTGTPSQVAAVVHVVPPVPTGLEKDTYDKDTDILTLTVIDPAVTWTDPGLPAL